VEMLLMYASGSRHSSSLGKYDGASKIPLGLTLGCVVGSLNSVGWPRRSTEVRSRAGLFKELSGTFALAGLKPFAFPFLLAFEAIWPGRPPTAGELRALALALPFKALVGVAAMTVAGPMIAGCCSRKCSRRNCIDRRGGSSAYVKGEAQAIVAQNSNRTIDAETIAWSRVSYRLYRLGEKVVANSTGLYSG
jgi:hypothetical protein